jgi:hypothetical protein
VVESGLEVNRKLEKVLCSPLSATSTNKVCINVLTVQAFYLYSVQRKERYVKRVLDNYEYTIYTFLFPKDA